MKTIEIRRLSNPQITVCPGTTCAGCPAHLVDEEGHEIGCAIGGDCSELDREIDLGKTA
jgi:hypothetical protein